MVQEQIERWLSRRVPGRATNQCFELPVVLSTDIGLQRSENQDRVAAVRIGAKANGDRPLIAVAVADGMGGMRDGSKCATLALASFFDALTRYRGYELERRATASIKYANDTVFKFAGGRGGATLSAVLLDSELQPFIVHLGDSRIYSFGSGMKVERLTTDDSLAEAVGGHGRELLQFVGMGDGVQPHVKKIEGSLLNLAITTDGIHFIEPLTLEGVLSHAPGLRPVSERLAAIARWCGGPDNASSALVELQPLIQEISNRTDNPIQLWDPFGTLTGMWIKPDLLTPEERQADARASDFSNTDEKKDDLQQVLAPGYSKGKPSSKKSRKNKKGNAPKKDIQLDIQIEQTANPEESNENSR